MELGWTKARSVGPIAAAIEQAGGSIARVFKQAELPTDVLREPDRPFLLRDQVRLLAFAVDEIGDPALPAKLSTGVGAAGLGPLGRRVCSAATLGEAIARAGAETKQLLQTATWTGLAPLDANSVLYGYQITERIDVGRQINEILALGYLLDVVRHFLGPGWRPERVVVTGATLPARNEVEAVFDCDVTLGGPTAGLVMPAECLRIANPDCHHLTDEHSADRMPAYGDFSACVEHLLLIGLGLGRPSIEWTSGRLGISRRSLQRRLIEERTTFGEIQQRVLQQKAKELLARPELSIADVAYELGYSDPAHFTRAFQGWIGMSPSKWRGESESGGAKRCKAGSERTDLRSTTRR